MNQIDRTIKQLDKMVDKYLDIIQSTQIELINIKKELHQIKNEMVTYDNQEK